MLPPNEVRDRTRIRAETEPVSLSIWGWKDHDYLEATTFRSLAWEIERFDHERKMKPAPERGVLLSLGRFPLKAAVVHDH